MAILDHVINIDPFWDDEYLHLDYEEEAFNNPLDTERWLKMGYRCNFVGAMCDMRKPQPSWNYQFIKIFQEMGWKDIGTSYYRMGTGTILPTHSDLYLRYIDIFKLQGQEQKIRRAIVFLEDWRPGHYFEGADQPTVNWRAGDVIEWAYDAPHMAANLGPDPRYTLQITGHL